MPTLFRLPAVAKALRLPYFPVTANLLLLGPVGVAVNPVTGAVYTAHIGDDTVSVISG